MSAEPVRLDNGVKCPHCLTGHFVWHSRTSRTSDGREVHGGYWKCSQDENPSCRRTYNPDTIAFRPGEAWAVVTHDGHGHRVTGHRFD